MTVYRLTTYAVRVSHPVDVSAEAVAAEVFEHGWNDLADPDDWADGIYVRSVCIEETGTHQVGA
jgi:hypothetical protein